MCIIDEITYINVAYNKSLLNKLCIIDFMNMNTERQQVARCAIQLDAICSVL